VGTNPEEYTASLLARTCKFSHTTMTTCGLNWVVGGHEGLILNEVGIKRIGDGHQPPLPSEIERALTVSSLSVVIFSLPLEPHTACLLCCLTGRDSTPQNFRCEGYTQIFWRCFIRLHNTTSKKTKNGMYTPSLVMLSY